VPYYDIIERIKFGDYHRAAEEMRHEALTEKGRSHTQGQMASVMTIERTLKSTHLKLRSLLKRVGKTPTEIAEETYEQTRQATGLDKFDDVIEAGGV